MMHSAIHGRLGRDPNQITTKTGTAMATAPVAVTLDGETLWVRVVAFNKLAEILLRHMKGEMVSVSGRCQLSKWTDQSGTPRETLEVIADSLISARSVRPSGGKKKSEVAST
ncbi:single-stranded DNA-binding protein [Mesorhizobium sp. CN2-181]|uniref:single-stranded DNA-binding protein n=1 Tax=Mesorhizobium yinganensis TaxID=3157707 RepID=UPI0032B73E21